MCVETIYTYKNCTMTWSSHFICYPHIELTHKQIGDPSCRFYKSSTVEVGVSRCQCKFRGTVCINKKKKDTYVIEKDPASLKLQPKKENKAEVGTPKIKEETDDNSSAFSPFQSSIPPFDLGPSATTQEPRTGMNSLENMIKEESANVEDRLGFYYATTTGFKDVEKELAEVMTTKRRKTEK